MKTPNSRHRGFQHGISLIELMVSSLIGLILLAGVVQLFSSSRATHRMNEGLSRVHDSGSFALQFLNRDLRMAGYTGCPEGSLEGRFGSIAADTTGQQLLRDNRFIFGMRNADAWAGLAAIPAGPGLPPVVPDIPGNVTLQANSDIVVTQHAGDFQVMVTNAPVEPHNIKIALGDDGLLTGDTVAITDCENAELLNITGIAPDPDQGILIISIATASSGQGSPGNLSNELQNTFDDTAHLGRFERNTYFVGTLDQSNANRPSLFRMDIRGNLRELVDGVTRMRIQYGLDTTGNDSADTYLNANAIPQADWNQVKSMRIALLVTSEEVLRANQPNAIVLLDDAEENFNDRRIRQVFTSTISIRNRTP